MARQPRLALAGALHQVRLCGHDGQAIVRDDEDRARMIGQLREAAAAARLAVHAYALIDSELQLLATPAEAVGLGLAIQALGRRYVAAFNARHARRGTLWDGRFRNSVVDPALLVEATVHVESLPVARGLVAHAGDWPWSSAGHHLGRQREALVSEHPAYWKIGNTPFEREHAHAHFLEQGVAPALAQRFDQALVRGHAVGSERFAQEVAAAAARPVQPRRRGRPGRTRDS